MWEPSHCKNNPTYHRWPTVGDQRECPHDEQSLIHHLLQQGDWCTVEPCEASQRGMLKKRCACMHAKALRSYPILCTLFCPWGFPGQNTGVGGHALLNGIFLTQGLNPRLLCLLPWQGVSLPPASPRKPRGRDGSCFIFGTCKSEGMTERWLRNWELGNVPGSPVVKTLSFHCWRYKFNPCSEN